ncbi:hypothetical protein NQ317_004178 [Molorchus minor]|uniref:Uncharacterized protein n=1 Tax=Molorchus minor TaxID=1323400 RepID=A0ABQ9J895_9CUCU|nr:hypothetical protein NQ317_004178 [Molorchus minor]
MFSMDTTRVMCNAFDEYTDMYDFYAMTNNYESVSSIFLWFRCPCIFIQGESIKVGLINSGATFYV